MTKEQLKKKYLKPKKKLFAERVRLGLSLTEMGSMVGINRNAYRDKEDGKYPFNDYEMKIISQKFELPIEYLFFID